MVLKTADDGFLVEIPEETAGAQVRLLYGRLRQALGINTVPLVYRHLAVVEDALPVLVRTAVRLSRQGLLERSDDVLGDQLLPASWEQSCVNSGGLNPKEVLAALRITETYSRSNPRNFTLLGTVVAMTSPEGTSNEVEQPSTHETVTSLPPAPRIEDLQSELVRRAQNLTFELGLDSRLLPSLHRHLGAYPRIYSFLMDRLDSLGGASWLRPASERFAREIEESVIAPAGGRRAVSGMPESSRRYLEQVWLSFRPAMSSHSVLSRLWHKELERIHERVVAVDERKDE